MSPWAATDLDPERVAAELMRRFPGACVWLGEYTGRWWALTRDRTGDRLIEAADPVTLAHLLATAGRDRPERDRHGRYSRACLQNSTAGRAAASPPGTPLPAVRSRPLSRRPARVRRRRSRGGWMRRVLASFVVLDVP